MTGTIIPERLEKLCVSPLLAEQKNREEAKRLKAEREEKARRMHREVTLLFERDPIGRLIAALLIAREGSDR